MTWIGALILLVGVFGIVGLLIWLASIEYLIVLMDGVEEEKDV